MNEFKDDCQFGYLMLELDSLTIPPMQDTIGSSDGSKISYKRKNTTDGNSKLNEIFMVRIKVGSESNSVFVAAPGRVLDAIH